ncbi:MAG: ATP-binding protein [Povalibacter sp.]
MLLRSVSLTGKTLLLIALGVTCVIAVSSAASYWMMFQQMQQRASDQLSRYVIQRGQAESEVFRLAHDMQQAIRRSVLASYPEYRNTATLARFERLFTRYPDGTIRSRRETIQGHESVSGWIHRDTPVDPELRQRMVLFHDIAEQFKPAALMRFSDIYFTAPEQINIGTDPPGVPLWAMTVAADFPQNAEDWVSSANRERNPTRQTVYQQMILDPVWKKLMSGVATPIDLDGRHIGTIHNDLFLDKMVEHLLRADFPNAEHCVLMADGSLVAHTGKMRDIIAANGKYRIEDSGDARLIALWHTIQENPRVPVSSYHAATDDYFAVSRIEGPGWYFASSVPGRIVRAEAFKASQWVLWPGLLSLMLLLGILAVIMRRQIALPLGQLTRAAERVACGEMQIEIPIQRRDELGRLATAFNEMTRRVAERDRALRKEKDELQDAMRTLRDNEAEILRQQEALLQGEKLASMGSLLAGVAHELNNPLSVVAGRAMMLESAAVDEVTRTGARKIRTAAERCERIVRTFLAMARQRQQQRIAVRLHDIIEASLDVLEYNLETSGVSVEYEPNLDIPELLADADQLHQVFINLFVNAQQAMSNSTSPRVLSISTHFHRHEQRIEVRVSDTGPGIPAEIRGRIFDPFFTTKPTGAGTGVGLSVALGLVQAHTGTLTVECPTAGGTVFIVVLPLIVPTGTA